MTYIWSSECKPLSLHPIYSGFFTKYFAFPQLNPSKDFSMTRQDNIRNATPVVQKTDWNASSYSWVTVCWRPPVLWGRVHENWQPERSHYGLKTNLCELLRRVRIRALFYQRWCPRVFRSSLWEPWPDGTGPRCVLRPRPLKPSRVMAPTEGRMKSFWGSTLSMEIYHL